MTPISPNDPSSLSNYLNLMAKAPKHHTIKPAPSYMKPKETTIKPIEVSPELFKTSKIWPQHYDSDLVNNNPMAGVKGVNIERAHQEKQSTFYQTKRKNKAVNRSKRLSPDLSEPTVEGWADQNQDHNLDLPKTKESRRNTLNADTLIEVGMANDTIVEDGIANGQWLPTYGD